MTQSSKNSSFEDHSTTKVYMKKLLYSECIFLMCKVGQTRLRLLFLTVRAPYGLYRLL